MARQDDTADTPVFVGAVFKTYSDIGRAISFALAHGDHVDLAPATPQRGTRKLGLEGPKPRLALPHPSQFANGKRGTAGQAVLNLLARGPLTRREIVANLPDYKPANLFYALTKLKQGGQLSHGGVHGDAYSINGAGPPIEDNRGKRPNGSLQDTVYEIIASHKTPIHFAEVRAKVPRKFTNRQIRQALERLYSKRGMITASGYRDSRTFALAAE